MCRCDGLCKRYRRVCERGGKLSKSVDVEQADQDEGRKDAYQRQGCNKDLQAFQAFMTRVYSDDKLLRMATAPVRARLAKAINCPPCCRQLKRTCMPPPRAA